MKNNIKAERSRRQMTQQELADELGVSRQAVHAIESGKFNPSTVLSLKISQIFGKQVNEIFFLDEEDQ